MSPYVGERQGRHADDVASVQPPTVNQCLVSDSEDLMSAPVCRPLSVDPPIHLNYRAPATKLLEGAAEANPRWFFRIIESLNLFNVSTL